MADRSVAIRLTANVQGLVAGFRTATKAAQDFGAKGLDKIAANEQHINSLSNTVGVLGLAMVGAATGAIKAAVDWESAWAGVLKTVDGTPDQLAAIEEGLRGLAKELPTSHAEIAGVAEAAGQLGIAADDVVDFTRTMVDLGETTNLTADEAATALARISNIMGTSASDVDRMGATIVDLGNNSATTEREIVELSTRLAAAGRQAGLVESDIFAIASTLTSVGVEAEAGGTAMSKVFTSIADAVRDGGDDLETFAQVSGMTGQEFRKAFGQDAAGAIGMFVEGMGRLSAEGESTSAVFDELGLTDQRLMRAIMSAGSATGLWADQLELASGAWDSNSALSTEAMKRYQTSAAQAKIAWNNIKDAAIEFGAVALPAVAQVAGAVSSLAQGIGSLSPEAKGATMALVGGGGLVLLGVAGLGRLATSVSGIRTALVGLGLSAKTAGVAMGGIGTALAVAGAGLTAWAMAQANAKALVQELSGALDQQTGALTENSDAWIANELTKDQGFGIGNTKSMIEAADEMGISVETLTAAFEGNAEAQAEAQAASEAWADSQGIDFLMRADSQASLFNETIREQANRLDDARRILADKNRVDGEAADSQGDLAETYTITASAIDDQTSSLEDLIDTMLEASGVVLSERDARRQYAETVAETTAAIAENDKGLDRNTEHGRANEAAMDAIVDAGLRVIESAKNNGASQETLQGIMQQTRDDFVAAATAAGLESEAAEQLATDLGLIPENVTTTIKADTSQATAMIEELKRKYDGMTMQAYIDLVTRDQGFSRAQAASAARYTGMAVSGRYATGGRVTGPGTGTSDSVPILASNGEYVVKTAAVNRYGRALFDDLNSMRFASGGYVGGSSAPAPVAGGGTVRLDPVDRALLRAVADRPIAVNGQVLSDAIRHTNRGLA